MVDALERTTEIVKKEGQLVIVHDKPIPVELKLHRGEVLRTVGFLKDREQYEPILAANAAIESWYGTGLVHLKARDEFPFRTRIDSFEEFQAWLDERWEWSYLEEKVIDRIREGFGGKEDGTVLYALGTADIVCFTRK